MRPRVSSRVPEGILYLLTAFGPFAFGCVEPWSRAALEILAFLLALACFLRGRQTVSRAAALLWLLPAAFATLGLLQLRAVAAPDGPRLLAPFTVAPSATSAAILLWTAYAAILWSVPRVLVTHEAARRYARFLFWLGIALTALGLAQKATGAHKLYWIRDASGTGDFGPYYNRDHAANLLLMSLGLGLGVVFSKLKPATEDAPAAARLRAAAPWAGGCLFLLAGILAANSRGAILALPLAGAALLLLGADFEADRRRRLARAAGAVAGAAAVVFLAFAYVGGAADAGGLVDESVMGRLFIYGDAWRWLRDAPLFGTGLGSFETIYPAYQDLALREIVQHAHSGWLEIALEAGAAGVLLELLAASLAALAALRAWRAARSREMRALIGGGLAAAAAFAAHALFEFCFQIPGNAAAFMGVVGFLLSAPAWADKDGARARPQPPPVWLAVPAAACFLWLCGAAARPAVAAALAGAPGDAAERTASVSRALDLDENPHLLKAQASVWSARADAGEKPDLSELRASLAYSLAAADQRPFDSAALYLAGAGLWRLDRRGDARIFLDRAETVRFAPVGPAPAGRR